jgi:hypothetical protein
MEEEPIDLLECVNEATPWFPVEQDKKRYEIHISSFTKHIF